MLETFNDLELGDQFKWLEIVTDQRGLFHIRRSGKWATKTSADGYLSSWGYNRTLPWQPKSIPGDNPYDKVMTVDSPVIKRRMPSVNVEKNKPETIDQVRRRPDTAGTMTKPGRENTDG